MSKNSDQIEKLLAYVTNAPGRVRIKNREKWEEYVSEIFTIRSRINILLKTMIPYLSEESLEKIYQEHKRQEQQLSNFNMMLNDLKKTQETKPKEDK